MGIFGIWGIGIFCSGKTNTDKDSRTTPTNGNQLTAADAQTQSTELNQRIVECQGKAATAGIFGGIALGAGIIGLIVGAVTLWPIYAILGGIALIIYALCKYVEYRSLIDEKKQSENANPDKCQSTENLQPPTEEQAPIENRDQSKVSNTDETPESKDQGQSQNPENQETKKI